jgi:acetylornithine deacetylase/succinyl-diaminopimelate desuccinylase-like protein
MRDHTPLSLAQALLRCPSITPAEGGALAAMADVLGQAGFAVERPVFSEPGTPDVHGDPSAVMLHRQTLHHPGPVAYVPRIPDVLCHPWGLGAPRAKPP